MDLEQGTAETLQDNLETPPVEETVSQEELTNEQKEEAAIAEEVKQHVKEDDPKGFQERINKLVRQYRSEERNRKKAEQEGTETKAVLEEMKKHNEKLYQAIQRQTNVLETSVESQAEKESKSEINNQIAVIQQRIAAIKGQRIQARTDMDWQRDAVLEDQLDALKEQLIMKCQEARGKQPKVTNEKHEQAVVTNWMTDTPWFAEFTADGKQNPEYNEDMADYARGKDKRMSESPKWTGIPIENRLAEVRKITEEHFKALEKQHGVTKIASVESAKNLPPPRKANEIQLTDDEKMIAHKTMPDLPPAEAEKYYAQYARGK